MDCSACTPRRPWRLPFLAEPEGVAALRRMLRIHLRLWGLPELTETAQLCVSELVSNVVTHVGPGTPATLAVLMCGTRLRIEVHDPDTRALPTLVDSAADAEAGRGMALVAAISERWGVQLLPERKVTWVELATSLSTPHGHIQNVHVSRAESVLGLYEMWHSVRPAASNRLTAAIAESAATEVIADLLHWLQVHGHDVDETLDRAQTRFEAQ
ncbi:ATP-binding protein [Streptomyces sp. IMTB 2501]|uniref:ATP-binding protein n=1 Tax=Streptomyces sp. IMTB 2501 TaxID=1776340 RepID=UPI00096E3450|nr:ATP-binding protein [Streptomyces sp. IMTB 2501]OLZ69900.1 ATP-binding protein [Streptomyces sp. IMTB 2501]